MNAATTARIRPSAEELARLCRRYHIRSLSVFGSVLREDFTPASDIDVLVEFEPGKVPGLEFVRMKKELARLFGHPVDLNTPNSLSPYFRDQVLGEAERLYASA